MSTSKAGYTPLQPTGGKIGQIQDELTEITGIMHNNIDELMKRENRLDELNQNASKLQENSGAFRKTAGEVRKKMWWQDLKMKVILYAVIAVIALVIVFVILNQLGVFKGGSATSSTGSSSNTKSALVPDPAPKIDTPNLLRRAHLSALDIVYK
ncbi:hypothetical protein HK098_005374 [Nowakowskiella sp. JEL0407]|nr:hypothetical protein HK098_005374 [Nowakowskiella sp. JEL0407]